VTARRSFVADLRVVLRGRDFRRLFATRLASQAGDGAFQVALASLFFFSPERAATATEAAAAFTVAVLPYTVIGPVAGVLLDIWPRRQVLVLANALRAAMVVGVAALVLSNVTGVALYVAALACMSVNRFFLAGLGAALPHVVPADELVMANAVAPTCGTVATLLGGGLAFLIRRGVGPSDTGDAVLLLIASCWYLGSAVLAARMDRDLLGPDLPPGTTRWRWSGAGSAVWAAVGEVYREMVAGARHVRQRRRAAHALAGIGAHRFAFGISTIATILLCRNYLNDPADVEAGLSLLISVVAATGLGIAAAALVTPPAASRIGPGGWIVACFAGAALAEAAFVVAISVPLLFVGGFVLGVAAQGSKICVDAIVQESVDDEFRGRVFSFYDVVFNAAFVAAAAVAALVVPSRGFSPTVFGVIAAIYALTAFGYWRAEFARGPRRAAPARRTT